MKQLIVAILVLVGTSEVFSQGFERFGMKGDTAPSGITVGSKAPNFIAIDQFDNPVELAAELKKGPVVLIFYRGAWCPYCVRYLQNVTDSISFIQEVGASVYAVTPQLSEGISAVSDKTDGQIPILHDQNGDIMNMYDGSFEVTEKYQERVASKKMNLAESNGQEVAALPVPATYVIDASGVILYRHFDVDYKKRATVAAIIHAFDSE